MKKLTTTVQTKDGTKREISVWLDDETAMVLLQSGDEKIIQDYIFEEYRTQLIERKETRRHQSLENSMENGFDIADKSVDVEGEAIKRCEAERLRKAIEQLEPQQRWLIKQVYFKERSQVEIAKELGVGESAIRSRLKKIIEKLKKYLN